MIAVAPHALPVAAHLPLPEHLTLTLVVDPRETRGKDDLLGALPVIVPYMERKLRIFDPAIRSVSGLVRSAPCQCQTETHPEIVFLDLVVTFPFALLPGDASRKLLLYVIALGLP